MSRCTGTKADGTPCSLPAQPGADTCWAHDPQNAAKRQQVARRGGRARGLPARAMADLESVASELQGICDAVLEGRVAPDVARAATNSLVAKQGALKLLREWFTTDQIAAQLDELEAGL